MGDAPIMQGRATTTVAAPPEVVYSLVADVERMGDWSPECRGATWDEGDGPRVGCWFTGHNAIGSFEWSTRSQVVAAEPGVELAWAVNGADDPIVTWRYRFTRAADGTTDVEESFVVHVLPKPLQGSPPERVAEREQMLVDGCRQTLARLKEAAEREASGAPV